MFNNDDEDLIIKIIAPMNVLINEVLSLRKQQLYPLLEDDEQKDINDLWDDLNYCDSSDTLYEWILRFRQYLWGNQYEWEEAKQWFTIEDELYYQDRIFKFIGKEFANNISDNNFIERINEKSEIKVIDIINKEKKAMKKRGIYTKNISKNSSMEEHEIYKYSEKICKKYKIKSLSYNFNLSFEEILFYLENLDDSLKDLVSLLKIKPEQIGMDILSISFEVNSNFEYYNYDIKNKSIDLGVSCYGFFAEAWMNFIDNIIGEKYNITNENIHYLSHMSFSALGDVSDNILSLKQSIRNKFGLNNSLSSSLFVMRNTLGNLPDLLLYINMSIHNNEIKSFIKNRVFDLKTIIYDIYQSENNNENYATWLKWRNESEILWKDMEDSKEKQKAYRSWVYTIALVEKLSFSKELPKHKMWYIFSVFKDKIKVKEGKYWSSYENLLSRSFASYLNNKMAKNSWLAKDKNDPMLYPIENELKAEIDWWNYWINTIIDIAYLKD